MTNWLSKSFFVFIGLAVVAGIVFAFLPQPEAVDLVRVERGNVQVTVDEDGKTRIQEKYVVSAPLSGRLLRIDMDPGDKVIAGETLLAAIEPRDPELLDARSLAQAEARVKGAEAVLAQAAPNLERARIDQVNADAELVRARGAYQKGGITESDYDTNVMIARKASEGIRAAEYAEDIAQFELQQAQAALLSSKPVTAEEGSEAAPTDWTFMIRSPISGQVLRVMQESAAVVTPGTPLLELGDPADLEVEIDVLSNDAVKIDPGDLVLLEHWGGEKPLEGRVRLVEPAGFTKISTLGVEEQRVNVIVDLEQPSEAPTEKRELLGDGFRVEARIVIAEARNVLRIPASALFREQNEWAIFKVIDGRAQKQRVRLGEQNGFFAEIKEGLSEGDQVVAHPSDRINDGTRVEQR